MASHLSKIHDPGRILLFFWESRLWIINTVNSAHVQLPIFLKLDRFVIPVLSTKYSHRQSKSWWSISNLCVKTLSFLKRKKKNGPAVELRDSRETWEQKPAKSFRFIRKTFNLYVLYWELVASTLILHF